MNPTIITNTTKLKHYSVISSACSLYSSIYAHKYCKSVQNRPNADYVLTPIVAHQLIWQRRLENKTRTNAKMCAQATCIQKISIAILGQYIVLEVSKFISGNLEETITIQF